MRRSFSAHVSLGLALGATLLIGSSTVHALPGEVLGEQKISSTAGGFGGVLANQDQFGSAVTSLTPVKESG